MNLFLQEGICVSPPFKITDPLCNSTNRPVLRDGYYFEMHNFDYFDYTNVNSVSNLTIQYEERYKRFVNCTHKWDADKLKVIMKPLGNMTRNGSGGWT